MATIENDNLIGFYANFNFGDNDQEVVKDYLWGEHGLKNKL